jgi:hypothetical protein
MHNRTENAMQLSAEERARGRTENLAPVCSPSKEEQVIVKNTSDSSGGTIFRFSNHFQAALEAS